jgi:hypothetical protein
VEEKGENTVCPTCYCSVPYFILKNGEKP